MRTLNCIVPLRLRIGGNPEDMDPDSLANTIAGAVQSRLHFAHAQIQGREGDLPQARYHLPQVSFTNEVPHSARAALEATIIKAIGRGVRGGPQQIEAGAPAFVLAGYHPPARARQALPPIWSITAKYKFQIKLRDYLQARASPGRRRDKDDEEINTVYADRLDEVQTANAWLVSVHIPTLLSPIVEELLNAIGKLPELDGRYPIWSWFVAEWARRSLLAAQQGHGLSGLPDLTTNPGRFVPSGDILLGVGGKLVFVFLSLPMVVLEENAILDKEISSTVRLRDLAFLVNVGDFQRFFAFSWDDYVKEFGDSPVILVVASFSTRKDVSAQSLRYQLREKVASRLSSKEAVFSHLELFNQDTVDRLPIPTRAALSKVISDFGLSPVASDRAGGVWEEGWFGLHIYTVLQPTEEERLASIFRPLARISADAIIAKLKEDRTVFPWAWRFLDLLSGSFGRQSKVERTYWVIAFDYFLREMEQRESGRWFRELFSAVENAHNGDLYVLFLRLCLGTSYASHPLVLHAAHLFNQRRMDFLKNTYRMEPKEIWLDKNPAWRRQIGDFIGSLEYDDKRLKPERLAELQYAVKLQGQKMVEEVLKGEDTQIYTQEEFAAAVVGAAAKIVGISDDDLETVKVKRALKFLDIRVNQEDGFDRFYITFEYWESVRGGAFALVENSHRVASDADFEFLLWAWEFSKVAEFWDTAIKVVSIAGVLAIAWEVGVVAALVELAGGALAVGLSIAISELIYLCTAEHYTLEGFFRAALEGYLFAVGFRFGGGVGNYVAKAIGAESLLRLVLGWIAERLTIGVVGGATSAFLITFSNDIVDNVAGRKKGLSSLGTYFRAAALGAVLGVAFEFAGAALKPLLKVAGLSGFRAAKAVLEHLQLNGIGAASWIELTDEAVAKLVARCKTFLRADEVEGIRAAFTERIREVTEAMRARLHTEVFVRALEVNGVTVTADVLRGLDKLLAGLEGKMSFDELLRVLDRLGKQPGLLQRFFDSLGTFDEAALGSLAPSGRLEGFAGKFKSPDAHPTLPEKLPPPPKALPKPDAPAVKPPDEIKPPAPDQTAPPQAEVKPPDPAPFKTMDDILTEDRKGFRDPKLDAAYKTYRETKIRRGEVPGEPEAWARLVKTGEPRAELVKELGPDYARQGGTSRQITLEEIARPAGYSEERLQGDLARLLSRQEKVFERLDNLKSKGIGEGTVDSGHFNIAKGNVAEVLSEPLQEGVLPEIQKRFPRAEIIRGIRIRLMGADGKLSQAKLFTDNVVGTWEGDNLVVHGTFEVKSGPTGGYTATEQFFEWVEGKLTDGSELLIPNKKPLVWFPDAPPGPGKGTVTGLSKANKYLIAAKGAEKLGIESGNQTTGTLDRLALPNSASEIDYLTRRVIETLKAP